MRRIGGRGRGGKPDRSLAWVMSILKWLISHSTIFRYLALHSCSVERLSNFRNSSILVILACAPVSRRGDPVGRPAPGRAKAASWYCNRGPQQNFRRPGRENYRTRPSKWTISGDFLLVSVAVHLRQRDLAATCGRASAQPTQFYGPTLTHKHVALVRSGVRSGEPGRVGV